MRVASEGASVGKSSGSSVRNVFEHAVAKSGIEKNGSRHSPRHRIDIHLLERGSDLHYIQV